MAEIVGIQLQVDPGNTEQSVGSLRSQLRAAREEVQAMAEQFGAASDQAVTAAKRAAELTDAIGDAQALTEAFNPDAKFQAFASALNGVTGGFAAVQGGMALLGVESEEVEKTLLKVQAAMALSQGLNSVLESKDAFVNLLTVLKQIPIVQRATAAANNLAAASMRLFGIATTQTSVAFKVLRGAILATGIGVLVVAIGLVVEAMQNFKSAAEDAAEAQDKLNKRIKESADAGLAGELAFLKRTEQIELARAKAEGANAQTLLEIQERFQRQRIASRQRYNAELVTQDEGRFDREQELLDEQTAAQVKAYEVQANAREEAEAKAKALADQRSAEAKAAEAQRIQEMDAAREERRQIEAQIIDERWEHEQGISEARAERQQAEFDAESQRLDEHLDNVLTSIDQNANAKIAIAERERDARIQAAQQVANGLNGFAALAGEQTAAGKAFAVASATIQTYLAATEAYASLAAIPIVGPALGAVAAGGAIAAGLANVRRILAVQVPGKGGGGSVGPAPAIGNTSAPIGATPSPLQQQVAMLDQQAINNQNAPVRAYVVESDITDKQDRITRIHNAASFQ